MIRNVIGNMVRNMVRNVVRNVVRDVIGDVIGDMIGNLIGGLTGNRTGNLIGNLIRRLIGSLIVSLIGDRSLFIHSESKRRGQRRISKAANSNEEAHLMCTSSIKTRYLPRMIQVKMMIEFKKRVVQWTLKASHIKLDPSRPFRTLFTFH